MVTHVVLFKFFDGVLPNSPAAQSMHSAMQMLPGLIDEIRDWQCGFNTTPGDKACDYVLVATFQSREDLISYFEHSAHVDVVEMADKIAKLQFGDLD